MRHLKRLLLPILAITWAAGPAAAQEPRAPDDALGSRLFFGSTGRTLKQGDGYLSVTSLMLPAMQMGITDRFSLGVGLPFYGAARALYVTPKFQIYRGGTTQVSTGLVHVFVRGFVEGGFAHVTATTGSANASVTFGGGWLYASDDAEQHGMPMFKIGGERRLSRRTSLITESYVMPTGAIVTLGGRFTRTNFSWDLGGLLIVGGDGLVGAPGIIVNFYWHRRPS